MVRVMVENLSEYQSPDLYDSEYGRYTGDFSIFVGVKDQGLALDLACGTGRLTIALAKSGLDCIGLDICSPMLEKARKKSEGLSISYIQGNFRDFNMNPKMDLIIMGGNAFQALLKNEDQQRLLFSVRSSLKKDGIFIFDTRNPTLSQLRTQQEFEFWHEFTDHTGDEVKVFGRQTYFPSKETVLYETKRVWKDKETITKIELRFTSAQEIRTLLEKAGLQIIELYGDVDKSPLTEKSPSIIVYCKLLDLETQFDHEFSLKEKVRRG